jgi:hypothetical protein
MKFLLCASSLLVLAVGLSSQDEGVSQLIVNGENARIEDHPYMVNVASTGLSYCGGAIITQRSVVTVSTHKIHPQPPLECLFSQAAHCLLGVLSRPFLVAAIVGSSYRDGRGGTTYRALRLFSHPDFVYPPYVNDVAVIRTVTAIQFGLNVQPIFLAGAEHIGVNVPGVFTGYGVSGYGPILVRWPDQLQKMYTRTIANDECRERYKVTDRYDWVVDQKLCVVSTPRTSVCAM